MPDFITYAHRGASAYCPENTMLSFYTGVYMGANGIETDVRRTRDGVLVLFHDKTMERAVGLPLDVGEYTYDEIKDLRICRGELWDRITTLERFLEDFGKREDLTLAIELKADGIEREVADLIRKHSSPDRVVVTSFQVHRLAVIKEYAKELRVGHLTRVADGTELSALSALGAYEICPHGDIVDAESVKKWHALGLNVRAWGIVDEDMMKRVYDAGADGMTVNFPDKMLAYIAKKNAVE